MPTELVVSLTLCVVASLMSILALLVIIVSLRAKYHLLDMRSSPKEEETAVIARREAMGRATQFERHLITIGSVELAILAYVAGYVLREDTVVHNEYLFYAIATMLFFAVTVAYLHAWKLYMAYGAYCIRLEIAAMGMGSRMLSQVFHAAQNPPMPKWLKPFVGAATSIQVVALFPVLILLAVIVAFGARFDVSATIVLPLCAIVLSWSIIYAVPPFIEFIRLINLACEVPVKIDDDST